MRLSFLSEATDELLDARQYYKAKHSQLGDEFSAEARATFERIRQSPEAWTLVDRDEKVRRCLMHRFPYGVIYRLWRGGIQIIAVMHGRRNPGYWRDRI